MTQAKKKGVAGWIRHILRAALAWWTVWTYTLMAPFGWALFAGLSYLWRADPLQRARRLQGIQTRAYRLLHDWLRLTDIADFNHRGALEGLPVEPCVVVANHPTLMDITAITAVVGSGCTIVKPALYQRRLLKGLLVDAGHIEGPGADPLGIGRILEEASERLRQGFSIIVFPEGTRSPEGRLHPFARTPFEIACRAGVPLVSLTVECDPVYLSKGVPKLSPPHPTPHLRLGLLAIDRPCQQGLDSRELQKKVEGRYQAWIENSAKARLSSPGFGRPRKGSTCQSSSRIS